MLPPCLTAAFGASHDEAVLSCLSDLLGAAPLPGTAARLAQLPFHEGGLGLRSAVSFAPSAFWGSWADVLPVLHSQVPDLAASVLRLLQAPGRRLPEAVMPSCCHPPQVAVPRRPSPGSFKMRSSPRRTRLLRHFCFRKLAPTAAVFSPARRAARSLPTLLRCSACFFVAALAPAFALYRPAAAGAIALSTFLVTIVQLAPEVPCAVAAALSSALLRGFAARPARASQPISCTRFECPCRPPGRQAHRSHC